MAKAKSKAKRQPEPAAASSEAPAIQQYPKALYAKGKDGKLVSRRAETAEHHAQIVAESSEYDWKDGPADHGVETHPAAQPVDVRPVE